MSLGEDPCFRLLFVCTGNVCRSAFAERFTCSKLLPYGERFVVTSGGIRALAGNPMEPLTARVLAAMGGNPEGFVSRPLTREMLTEPDLVLTASREHRAASAELLPSAARRIFTIREFAVLSALTDHDPITRLPTPPQRAHALAAMVIAVRGQASAKSLADIDIADPFGAAPHKHQKAGSQIAQALALPLSLITGLTATTEPEPPKGILTRYRQWRGMARRSPSRQ